MRDIVLQFRVARTDSRAFEAEVYLDGTRQYSSRVSCAGCSLSRRSGFTELVECYRAGPAPASSPQSTESFPALKALGSELLKRLFPDLRIQWFRRLRRSLEAGQRLVLEFVYSESGFEDIPFELLHDEEATPSPGQGFLALSMDILIRHRYDKGIPETEASSAQADRASGGLSLLFLGVSPRDSAAINVEQERKCIRDAQTGAGIDGFAVDVKPDREVRVTRDTLVHMGQTGRLPLASGVEGRRESLGLESFNLVHLSAHGEIDSSTSGEELVLETEDGESDPVPGDLVGKVLGRGRRFALVTLNTCWGLRLGNRLLEQGACRILANRAVASDRGSLEFSRVFYRELFHGLGVEDALRSARLALFELAMAPPSGRAAHKVQPWDWANPVLVETADCWFPRSERRDALPSRPKWRRLAIAGALAAMALAAAAWWFLFMAHDSEIQVNQWTEGSQQYPRVSSLRGSAGAVVVWASDYQDGSAKGVYGRLFDLDGRPTGDEFRVNTRTSGDQNGPSAAAMPDGGFLVAWGSAGPRGDDVFAQRFGPDGKPLRAEFQVNSYTEGDQHLPRMAPLSSGRTVLVWMSLGQDTPPGLPTRDKAENKSGDSAVVARILETNDALLSDEFLVNTWTAGDQKKPVVAALTDGTFVIAWESLGVDGDAEGIVCRRYDDMGGALSPEIHVNTTVRGEQKWPDIAALPSLEGLFVVVWPSEDGDGKDKGVLAQVMSASGDKMGPEVLVNDYTEESQWMPSVAALDQNRYAVVWSSGMQDGAGYGIYMRVVRVDGTKEGAEVRMNRTVAGDQLRPSVAVLENGNLFVTWDSAGQDGAGTGVFSSCFTPHQLAQFTR